MRSGFGLHHLIVLLLLAGMPSPSLAAAPLVPTHQPMRAVQLDLDYVYDQDPAQTDRNLDELVERIGKIGPSAVFLQAFADPKGSGLAREVYFPNRNLPVRADLFNRAVAALHEKAHVLVFGWLPVLSFDLGANVGLVEAWATATGEAAPDANAYRRISPFDAASRQKIIEIYEDMARAAPIDGLLFHDDATLSDFEDAGPAALAAYKAAGLPDSIKELRADDTTLNKWTDFKTDTLIAFTRQLAAHAGQYRSPLLTVRNIYAPVMLDPASRTWFAQDYDKFLAAYDYTAVEAMPRMEKIADDQAHDWLRKLIDTGAGRPQGLHRTIFELQSVDWNLEKAGKDRAIPPETLGGQMRLLARQGAMNFAYYPDDFVTDTPKAELLHNDFSLQNYPNAP